ncbi:hypothetical protein SGRA_1532 [Saprospira grandis str. Lewin]|uniref:Uncharacterized protein n=1 Tax=Saprospira grandis (strain Lewin) TaxID=984262 RepID=H6L995_SAPGL|nr:hypothetical protein SGRA_1532 [Saprospira grandis str. Lewin]
MDSSGRRPDLVFERSEKTQGRATRPTGADAAKQVTASCDNQPRRGASSMTNGNTQPDPPAGRGSPKKEAEKQRIVAKFLALLQTAKKQ